MPHTFGFVARYTPAYYDGDSSGWEVKLPHQCDSWAIHAASDYDGPVSKAEAIDRLSLFIAEAEDLLTQLRGQPDDPDREIELRRSAA